jgi:hypothetical protein
MNLRHANRLIMQTSQSHDPRNATIAAPHDPAALAHQWPGPRQILPKGGAAQQSSAVTCPSSPASPCSGDVRRLSGRGHCNPCRLRSGRGVVGCRRVAPAVPGNDRQCAGAGVLSHHCRVAAAPGDEVAAGKAASGGLKPPCDRPCGSQRQHPDYHGWARPVPPLRLPSPQ